MRNAIGDEVGYTMNMEQPLYTTGDRFIWLGLIGIWGASFVYSSTPLNDEVWCIWRRFVDLECFGCGLTRSFIAASAGNFSGALDAHPVGPFLYAAMVWNIVMMTLRKAAGRPTWLRLSDRAVLVFWSTTAVVFCAHAAVVVGRWFDA